MSPSLATPRAHRAPAAPPAVATVLDFGFELAPGAVRAPSPLASALLVLLKIGVAGSAGA